MRLKNLSRTLFILILAMTLSGTARASTPDAPSRISGVRQVTGTAYYVDIGHSSADDANPGTESLPWQHCPGMPGWSGSVELQAGDVVYFNNAATWTVASGDAILQVVGGVTYDGSTWGSGSRATLRATGDLGRSVISFMDDHPTEPTVVRGFEVDANNRLTSGIGANWPQASGDLTGATKRIENCIVHGVYSHSAEGQYEYGIVVSSGYGGNRHVSNIEILDCVTYDISRGGINIYAANDDPSSGISNVLVRGCEVYGNGTDPNYAGSTLALKNHISNVVVEYNYLHNPERGTGIGISTHTEPGFIGPENTIIRHNIIREIPHVGIYAQGGGAKSVDIYGNIFTNNQYEGIRLASSLSDALAMRIYNNTFYHNYEINWGYELRIESNTADISTLEVSNNLFYTSAPNTRLLGDDDGDITAHGNNLFYHEDDGTLVIASGSSYTAGNLTSWEATALADDPLFKAPSNLPAGFIGTYGVDMAPLNDGLSLTEDSPARDHGAALDSDYSSSINSTSRPSGAGWDIGAYEFAPTAPTLTLQGTPADRAIRLTWEVDNVLPPASTWQIDYTSDTGTAYLPVTGILSPTRATTLTGLTNGVWYSVTLSAMLDGSAFLSDTVRVMPFDPAALTQRVYLPLVLR